MDPQNVEFINIGLNGSTSNTTNARNVTFEDLSTESFTTNQEEDGTYNGFHSDHYDDERNNNTTERSENDSEQLLGERNFREGMEHIRQRLDSTREGQTLIRFFLNTFPFVALFAVKFILDHFSDILLLALLIFFFLQADFYVEKCFNGGFEYQNRIFRTMYVVTYCSIVFIYLHYVNVEDFGFKNAFTLNIVYFVSGEFATLGMATTFFGIVVVDMTCKLLTIIPKLAIVSIPNTLVTPTRKRRLFQLIEYISQLYRCLLPFGPWVRYFMLSASPMGMFSWGLTLTYICLKFVELIRYVTNVKKSLKYFYEDCPFGEKQFGLVEVMCTVCHEDVNEPIMLECKHIFCKVCIETWLDRNSTCPMCRAVIRKNSDENDWKTGVTSKSLRFF